MNIENELIGFLKNNLKENVTKSRDIDLIAYYYGFGKASYPTYDKTANHFQVGTRERIRQILNAKFRDYVTISDLPSIQRVTDLLQSKRYWLVSDLEKTLVSNGFVAADYSISGILRLLSDVGIDCNYELYTSELTKAFQSNLASSDSMYLMDSGEIKKIKPLLKKAKGLPGRCGIANLKYLKDALGIYFDLVKAIIKSSPTSWCYSDNEGFWFLYEDRHNTILTYHKKVFAFFTKVSTARLSQAYRNALSARTHKYPYPPPRLLKRYLETSAYFDYDGENVSFLGQPQPRKLKEIEIDVVAYLEEKGEVTSPEFHQFLRGKGYGDPIVSKAIRNSPLVYVNKTSGATYHKYSLVGPSI